MGVTSLVLGILSLITGWIPFVCFFAFILAVIGLILGIVDTVKKSKANDKRRGISIAGLIISAVAIPIIVIMSFTSIVIFFAIVEDDYDYRDYNYYNDYYDDYYDYNNNYDDWYNEWYDTYYNQLNMYNSI